MSIVFINTGDEENRYYVLIPVRYAGREERQISSSGGCPVNECCTFPYKETAISPLLLETGRTDTIF